MINIGLIDENASSSEAEVFLLKASDSYKNGDYENAIKNFSKAIEICPSFSTFYNIAQAYIQDDDYDFAIINFEKAIELNPKFVKTYLACSEVYQLQEKYNESINCISKAIELESNNPELYYMRGLFFDSANNQNYAYQDFQKSIELDENFAKAYNRCGLFNLNRGDFGDSIYYFSMAIKKDPCFMAPYQNRASAYRKVSNYRKAINDYSYVITQEHPDSTNSHSAYFRRKNTFLELNDPKLEIKIYTEEINLFPNMIENYLNRGKAYCLTEEYSEAIEDFTYVIDLNHDIYAFFLRGRSFFYCSNYKKALIDLKLVTKSVPSPGKYVRKDIDFHIVEAHYLCGIIYANTDEFEKASNSFKMALQIDKNCLPAVIGLCHLYSIEDDEENGNEYFNMAINMLLRKNE
jgi:tetratricopeptide (TPR) repeat protein